MMDFGELRSRLAGRQDSQGWALVRRWAEQAWEAEPERFEAEWLPYLIDQVGRWRARVCDCPAPWKRRLLTGRFAPMQLVRALHFQQDEPHIADILAAMADSADLGQLEALSLPYASQAQRGLEALGRAQLPALRALDIAGVAVGHGAISVKVLAQAGWLGQLERLSLGGADAAGLLALLEGGLGPGLEELDALDLRGDLPATLLPALWRAAPGLKRVVLDGAAVSERGLTALHAAPCAQTLTALSLGKASLRGATIKALCAGPLPALRELTLRAAQLSSADVQALIAWIIRDAPALRLLNLARNGFDADALARLGELSGLRTLVLSHNPIGDVGVQRIIDARWERLVALGVESCSVSAMQLIALLRSDAASGLRHIALQDNGRWQRASQHALNEALRRPDSPITLQHHYLL